MSYQLALPQRQSKYLALLVAPPSTTRSALVSVLEQQGISAKVSEFHPNGLAEGFKPAEFDAIVVDQRAGGEGPARGRPAGRRPPLVALNVGLSREAEALQQGATVVFGPGYSPRSVALTVGNLIALAEGPRRSGAAPRPAADPDYGFGPATVSPSRRLLLFQRKEAALTPLLLKLLATLRRSRGRVVGYEFLSHVLWRRAHQRGNGAMREAVSALRGRFREVGLDMDLWIRTLRGQGYVCRTRPADRPFTKTTRTQAPRPARRGPARSPAPASP